MAQKIQRCGRIAGLPDERDQLFAPEPELAAQLAPVADLRPGNTVWRGSTTLLLRGAQAVAGDQVQDQKSKWAMGDDYRLSKRALAALPFRHAHIRLSAYRGLQNV